MLLRSFVGVNSGLCFKVVPKRRYNSKIEGNPALITVAITGDVHTKTRNISVPMTPKEQIESTQEAHEAGATLVHIHVRDEKGLCTWHPDKYGEVIDGLRKYCPDLIIEFSLGNYAPTVENRIACLKHKPDLASLCPGSVNFKMSRPGTHVGRQFLNSHEDIEILCRTMLENDIKPDVAIFDMSMIYHTNDLIRHGLIKKPVRLMYVMGGHMALEARRPLLEFMVAESKAIFGEDNFNWCCVGVGWNHSATQKWALEMGGHPRTGFEDTLMLSRGNFATSNAQFVKNITSLANEVGRRIATPNEARQILGLEP